MTQFNELLEALKFLVDLRVEVSRLARHDAKLAAVKSDLKKLLISWFDVGLLELRRITWNTPAALLEKLIDYEAVHQIRSWHDDAELCEALRGPLVRNCAHFLVQDAIDGRALDRVAHFHLSNGARVERINWLADLSDNGMRQSAGLMVNYLYKLEDIEVNHEAYRGDSRITAAAAVKNLLKNLIALNAPLRV